jgi:predicted ATPase
VGGGGKIRARRTLTKNITKAINQLLSRRGAPKEIVAHSKPKDAEEHSPKVAKKDADELRQTYFLKTTVRTSSIQVG